MDCRSYAISRLIRIPVNIVNRRGQEELHILSEGEPWPRFRMLGQEIEVVIRANLTRTLLTEFCAETLLSIHWLPFWKNARPAIYFARWVYCITRVPASAEGAWTVL